VTAEFLEALYVDHCREAPRLEKNEPEQATGKSVPAGNKLTSRHNLRLAAFG